MRFRLATAAVVLAALSCGRTEPLFIQLPSGIAPDGGASGPGPADGGGSDAGCVPLISPTIIDFGVVDPAVTYVASTTLTNVGDADCVFDDIALGAGSDPSFQVAPFVPGEVTIGPGDELFLSATFVEDDGGPPRQRTGTLVFSEVAPSPQPFSVPLSATIAIGCVLTASPVPLNLGNVALNTDATGTLTLTNSGDQQCLVTNVYVGEDGGSPLFTLPGPHNPAAVGPNGGTTTIKVGFSATDSTAPHQRQNQLNFTVSQPFGEPRLPTAGMAVPLAANIDTACHAGSQWIYTIDTNGDLATFDPETLTFTDLGILNCPVPPDQSPFSMAVDQSTIAWVEFADTTLGTQSLERVDPTTLDCTDTGYIPDPSITDFGMGFVYEPDAGTDTLYVSGTTNAAFLALDGGKPSTLATIAFPSLALTPVGPISFGAPELTGTGDGQLWGFAPAAESIDGSDTLAQIDPTTGKVLVAYTYEIHAGGGYAMKFWGGSLWIFTGMSIYQADRTNGSISLVVADSGRTVVGAGVSTCAPLTPP